MVRYVTQNGLLPYFYSLLLFSVKSFTSFLRNTTCRNTIVLTQLVFSDDSFKSQMINLFSCLGTATISIPTTPVKSSPFSYLYTNIYIAYNNNTAVPDPNPDRNPIGQVRAPPIRRLVVGLYEVR